MQRLLMEILYCDRKNVRNTGKVTVVELTSNDDEVYSVLTHSVRTNPQKHQRKKLSSRIRLQTEYQETALSMFKSILAEKQKSGFRFLKNGEKIAVPHFKDIFNTELKAKKSKPRVKEIAPEQPTYRKLAI
jgi:phage gp16-like protein